MTYDLLIKHGRIIDGSGMPAFRGDVGVAHGKIAELFGADLAAILTSQVAGGVS